MKIKIIEKINKSLFYKLLLIFIIANVLLLFIAFYGFGMVMHSVRFIGVQRNNVNYSYYLADEIGNPPDTTIANKLVQNNKIQISIETLQYKYKSNNNIPNVNDIDIPQYKFDKNVRAGFDGGLFVIIQRDETTFLFKMESHEEGFPYAFQIYLLIIIAAMLSVLLVIYFLINRLLKPIKQLHLAVSELSEGNLEYKVSSNRVDELGELTKSFNQMTKRLKEMLHAREQLLLDVSHELRSPLTRIKVALEFLEDKKIKRNISDDINEVEIMITELLETERLKSHYGGIKFANIDLIDIIQKISYEFKNSKPGIKLINFPKSLLFVGDEERLKLLFKNILENAIKYSNPDGYAVEISIRKKNDKVTIIIQDFGTGIPEQDIPYIFEPFYRVDKSRSKNTGGYGLGMNISKKIIEAHGGTIEISSKLDVGTTIFLKFNMQ